MILHLIRHPRPLVRAGSGHRTMLLSNQVFTWPSSGPQNFGSIRWYWVGNGGTPDRGWVPGTTG